ncbi:uncharacterized protein BT62DRAFT_922424 [Guyanagaster necrorhizus]|uniref:Uncharacterized protein n=1 Tax=Guyanagaster necrorhizus TaxID=856835 RepID=A0A9P7VMP4_9AGAR|nr:uncharacterized protein BT62DRAFT_922424 [Guyanagaster necrorhizus MCA 3950]KAG7442709.1 hypothetical protein BT62DRAFT_922424 [Guyanagaster necrorhizus MCA 3950]
MLAIFDTKLVKNSGKEYNFLAAEALESASSEAESSALVDSSSSSKVRAFFISTPKASKQTINVPSTGRMSPSNISRESSDALPSSHESNFFFIEAYLPMPPPVASSSNKHMQDTERAIEASAFKHLYGNSSSHSLIAKNDKASKPSIGHSCKVMEGVAKEVCKCSSLRESISKVSDQDFGAFVGCKSVYFKWELASKIGYFSQCAMPESLITKFWGLLHKLH